MQKRRILIVDNNDELRALLEHALSGLGCEAVVTGDREEALSRDDLGDFDLIISDLTEEDGESSDDLTAQATGPTGPGDQSTAQSATQSNPPPAARSTANSPATMLP